MQQIRFCAGVVLVSALAGCAQPGPSAVDQPAPSLPSPMTAICQGNAIPDSHNQFRVSVLKVERATRVKKSAIAVLSQPGQGEYATALASFLILSVQFENVTTQPLAWVSSPGRLVSYKLVADDGRTFQASIYGTFSGLTPDESQVVNPSLSIRGAIVFDVPKAPLNFVIGSTGTGGGFMVEAGNLIQCKLGTV